MATSKKPNFGDFAKSVKPKKILKVTSKRKLTTKYMQCRVNTSDAKAFIRAAEDNDIDSVQDAMIEAINVLMIQWGKSPISNPGTSRK